MVAETPRDSELVVRALEGDQQAFGGSGQVVEVLLCGVSELVTERVQRVQLAARIMAGAMLRAAREKPTRDAEGGGKPVV